ncbi:alpha-glucosidase [Prevotella sp. CAG:732]|nr:alpha-glucosidase [Prevotella sp. CAG:732]
MENASGEIGRWITCSYNDLLSLIREFLKLNVKITLFVFAHIIYFIIFAIGNLNNKDKTMQKSITTSLLLLAALCAQANNYTVKSPDGKLQVNVECEGGKVSYTVDYEGKQMLTRSALGLVANYGDFSQNLTMGKLTDMGVEHVAYDESRIKKAHVEKDVVEANIGFLNEKKDSMTLHLHVSNNDMAYRYELIRPKKDNPKSVIIYKEVSGFNFPQQTTTFLCPQITPMTGWERTKPSYEEEYTPDAPMNKKSQFGVGYTFPCLFKVGEDGWVLVSETGVSSAYPGSRLSDYDPEHGYTIAFPQKGENNGIGSEYAGIPLPGKTPWRTITIGKTLAPIVETTIPFDVVAPLYEPSINYKPARYTWSWLIWQDNSVNYDDQIKMIDVAAAQGYEAVLVDGCWDTQIGYGRIEELSKYAQSKGVKLMLWYNSNGFENDAPQTPRQVMNNSIARKRDMAWMKKIGVCGIKVDFFGGDKQETMKLYEDILSNANDYGLEVIFHGCTMPRGWERMYPNYVASEAALASENVYFTDYHAKKEAFEMTMHPFSRNAVGSFDWGGVMMNKYMSRDNKSRHQRFTSDVFEMATAITNQSSVNCVCLYPNNLEDVPQWELDWLKAVPTAWEDVKFIAGYPTRYAVVARKASSANGSTAQKSNGKWFVGGLNATDKPLTLTLDLPMFAGKTVEYLTDMPKKKGDKFFTSVKKTLKVGKDGKAKVTIQPMGGIVID